MDDFFISINFPILTNKAIEQNKSQKLIIYLCFELFGLRIKFRYQLV